MFFYTVSTVDLYLVNFVLFLLLTVIIWSVTFLLGDNNSVFYYKPFNCGFEIDQHAQTVNTNVRFFIVGLLFLVFDVELILLLPICLGFSEINGFLLLSFLLFFNILTLLMVVETSKDFLAII
jgi:NADH-ubiquinone oxidoreductase chain 3